MRVETLLWSGFRQFMHWDIKAVVFSPLISLFHDLVFQAFHVAKYHTNFKVTVSKKSFHHRGKAEMSRS